MAEPALKPPPAVPPPRGADRALERREARAEEGRRAFLRLASHELRTPLNAIIGFSEIISQELYGPLDEPRYREHAALIRESGLKLLRLVNQVLDIARLEMGAGELDLRPESCAVAMAAAERAVADEAMERGVTLVRRLEPGAEWACADARGLALALTNLLQNAVQASPRGGEVRLLARPTPDGRVALAVEDDGPGLPTRALARVMRPFEQETSALVRAGDGSGLGLPTTRLLADAMGGTLRLYSEIGCGLIAVLRLPAAAAPAPTPLERGDAAHKSRPLPPGPRTAMATPSDELDAMAEEFEFLGDWEERYRHLIDLGRALPPLAESEHEDAYRVRGCASQVWLVTEPQPDGRLRFRGDSDAHIVKGLMAVVLRLYSGATPREIEGFDARAAFDRLGLAGALSAQRSNGLASMVERIRRDAEAASA